MRAKFEMSMCFFLLWPVQAVRGNQNASLMAGWQAAARKP